MTKHILNRLIEGKPLTPVEDTPDIWKRCARGHENPKVYQCERISSLFKSVYTDGLTKYSDVDRVVCVDIDDGYTYTNCIIARVIDEMFPISMPYMPENEQFKVYCSELLTDSENGDYDTKALHYVIKPDGDKIEINRFFKEDSDIYHDWVEIDQDEYSLRELMDERRRESESDWLDTRKEDDNDR